MNVNEAPAARHAVRRLIRLANRLHAEADAELRRVRWFPDLSSQRPRLAGRRPNLRVVR